MDLFGNFVTEYRRNEQLFTILIAVVQVACLNNDVERKKILLVIKWANFKEMNREEFDKFVLNYWDVELKNFNLLNPLKKPTLEELEQQVSIAMNNEDYLKVKELKEQINNLKK